MNAASHSPPFDSPAPHAEVRGAQISSPIRISVCIPAYNEQEVIAETVAEAAAVLDQIPGRHEIIVVDDGSQDRTWEILQHLVKHEPMLRIIRHSGNRGNAEAQRTLVTAARGKFIFHIGADGEWRMAEIPRMLGPLEDGCDVVIGVRRKKQYPWWRRLVSAAFNWSVAAMAGKHFGDLGSIKMVRASLWKQVPFGAASAFVHAERVLIAYRNGARIATVPVDHTARRTGRSKFSNLTQVIRATGDMLRFWLSPRSRYRLPRGCRRR